MVQRVRLSGFWFLYTQMIRQMGRSSLWAPLFVQAVLAILLAMVHYYIFSPITGPLVRTWVQLVNSEFADVFYSYPAHFSLLPYFFGIARMVVNILVEALLFGVVIDLLISLYRGEKPILMQSARRATGRYIQLAGTWLVVIVVLYVVNRYFNSFVEDVLGYSLRGSPRRLLMADLTLRGITILIYSAWIFMLPSIMAGGVTFGSALKRGFRLFSRHPFVAIGLVLIPYILGFLPSWALSNPARIVNNFTPELVFYLALISIVVDVVVNFVLLCTSLKFFMDQSE